MIKKLLLINFFAVTGLIFGQQTKKLQTIKQKYDAEIKNFSKICNENLNKSASEEAKGKISDQCRSALFLINSRRNGENLQELARIKSEGTGNDIAGLDEDSAVISSVEEMADYPDGIPAFRNEVSNNFDAEAISGDGILRCEIIFIIERDGSISDVRAAGNNSDFNRQAELAVYLTKNKFSPARINGVPTRYRYRMPLSLSFE